MIAIMNILCLLAPLIILLGWIKPTAVLRTKNPSRDEVLQYYGSAYVALLMLTAIIQIPFFGSSKNNYNSDPISLTNSGQQSKPDEEIDLCQFNMTLKEFKKDTPSSRKMISRNYVKCNSLPDISIDQFYTCLSDMSRNKDEQLTVDKILNWCMLDYQDNPDSLMEKYINYDKFEEQFHAWDGSHKKLEKLIKQNMNDEDSYKHIETRYNIIRNKSDRYAIVETSFSGNNAFGGRVKSIVLAKVDINTGNIIEILEQR